MVTILSLLVTYSLLFLFKQNKILEDLDTHVLGRRGRREKIKKIKRKTVQKILGFTIGSACLILSLFFLFSFFYFPVEYKIVSDSVQETVYLSGVQYDEDTLFYVAEDVIDGENKYYYFTLRNNERWMETMDIEKATIEEVDINDMPQVEKNMVRYSSKPTYRNALFSFIIHDFGFHRLEYFQPKEEMIEENVVEEEYIIRIPTGEIPLIDIDTLRFSYNR